MGKTGFRDNLWTCEVIHSTGVLKKGFLNKVCISLFDFPILPITETTLESENKASQKFYYDSPSDLLTTISKIIKETDVVLDIGCGIRPMTYFKPKIHLMIEPYQEYVDMLSYKFTGDKSAIIFCKDALLSLQDLSDGSVDSVFLLDVIEHMEKDIGRQVIQHCERVAREQIVLFTPLGFMPQCAESNIDAWGLSGGQYQEHLSGWEPDDFKDGWHFHICKNFHNLDLKGDGVEKFYGAFFAIKNIVKTSSMTPATLDDITIPFFSVNDAEKLYYANIELQASNQNLQKSYIDLINSRGMRMIGFVRSFLNIFRLKHKVV